jgi:hypothetical protein
MYAYSPCYGSPIAVLQSAHYKCTQLLAIGGYYLTRNLRVELNLIVHHDKRISSLSSADIQFYGNSSIKIYPGIYDTVFPSQ